MNWMCFLMRVVKKCFKKIAQVILFLISILFSILLLVIGCHIGLFMTFTIISLFIFVISIILYKFESELRAFFNPNFSYNKIKRRKRKRKRNLDRKVIKKAREKIKDQQEKQEKQRKALEFLTFYVKDMKKLGVIQIFTIVGLIITGLKFVVFHYAKSLYINSSGIDIWRNFSFYVDLNTQLNEDFFISSILVIYFAIVFYIYKTNFIFQCSLIKENNKNKSEKP